MGPFSLALDGIADPTQESAFLAYLDKGTKDIARRAPPSPEIHNDDEVAEAVRAEDMKDPVAAYMFTIVMAYYHYLKFRSEVPDDINEREGLAGLTWVFLQIPLTMYDVESKYLEVFIKGTNERKNQDKNLLLESKESGQFADAVGTHNS
ncbi:hypothetical protein FBU30_002686 [Linnemannia zychae]|nr:hypothetical protein FBU30_002686 [Linnemannia zychae]